MKTIEETQFILALYCVAIIARTHIYIYIYKIISNIYCIARAHTYMLAKLFSTLNI